MYRVAAAVATMHSVTDRQADGRRTDGQTDIITPIADRLKITQYPLRRAT